MNRLYSAGYRICMLINAQMTEGRSAAHGVSGIVEGYYDLLTGPITDILESDKKIVAATMDAANGAPPNHWVVLRSRVTLVNEKVDLTIFTWGDGEFHIPPISTQDFAFSYFGYVAAKP